MARGGAAGGGRARGPERAVAAAIVLLPLALVWLRCGLDPTVAFVVQRPAAPWIAAAAPVTAELQQWGETEAPTTSFARRFEVPEPPPAQTVLKLRAFGAVRLFLNGDELPERRAAGRGRAEDAVALGGRLRPGENELRVEVANARGPALLSLRSEGLAPALVSGEHWSARAPGGEWSGAVLADDTRPNPHALAVDSPAEAVREKADSLLLLFVLGAGASWLARRRPGAEVARWLAAGAPIAASAAWLYVFVAKTSRIPVAIGFDARHHLEYMELVRGGVLPLATDGWSTYHPPLFYGLAAAVAGLGAGEVWLKALPMLSGLAIVWLAWGLVRRLEPEHPASAALAALFAAVLPVSLYSSAYFSNEAFHASLASAALLAAVGWLLAEGVAWRRLALAALLFGLAALAKFTVLVTLPVALFFAAWKLQRVERIGAGRSAAVLAAWLGIFLLVAGWFYARNQLHFGSPVVGNWALPGEGRIWWLQPGFHTPAWYTRFGEALLHPYLAGFHSFWDSVYSTFWGDGFIAGRVDPYRRHDFWNYGFMSAGYWAALPAAVLLPWGAFALLREALGAGPPRRRLALGFLLTTIWAVWLAFFTLTLQLPFFAQAKAAYLLMCAAPLALCFAAGFRSLDTLAARAGPWPRAALHGWLALFAGTLFLGFAG